MVLSKLSRQPGVNESKQVLTASAHLPLLLHRTRAHNGSVHTLAWDTNERALA